MWYRTFSLLQGSEETVRRVLRRILLPYHSGGRGVVFVSGGRIEFLPDSALLARPETAPYPERTRCR